MVIHGGNTLYFIDTDGNNLLTIDRGYPNANVYPSILILDTIQFFKNQNGSNSLKIGEDSNYVLATDEGDFSVQGGSATFGTSDNSVGFDVYPSVSAYIWGPLNVDGNVYADNISSDRRLKEDIKDSNINAIDIIKQIKHRQFKMKKDNRHYNVGYIAQELEEISKDFILKKEKTDKEEDRYYVNELPIIATATKAIQEQQEKIEELKEKDKQKDILIQSLIERIEKLEKEIK